MAKPSKGANRCLLPGREGDNPGDHISGANPVNRGCDKADTGRSLGQVRNSMLPPGKGGSPDAGDREANTGEGLADTIPELMREHAGSKSSKKTCARQSRTSADGRSISSVHPVGSRARIGPAAWSVGA